MDDKIKHMESLHKQILQQFNLALGTSIKNFDELAVFKNYLPAEFRKLQDLCLFLEKEFLDCAGAKAYFSACLSGAAMIEAFLLLLCWLNKDEVIASVPYKKHAKTRDFDAVWGSLSLESLIEIAETLKWIPADMVKADLSSAIALGYEEIAVARGMDAQAISKGKESLMLHPAIALFDLMRELRNCLHAGRWIRQDKPFNPEPFGQWSHLGVILIGEIRDCLVIKFTKDMQKRLSNSIDDLKASITKFQETFAAKAKP